MNKESFCKIQKRGERVKLRPVQQAVTNEGWSRGLDKYSPSKAATFSPIKASLGNLTNVFRNLNDTYVDMFSWVVSMSEQCFYDNAFMLLSYSKESPRNMAKVLHRNIIGVDMDFINNLQDVTYLGGGSFGNVYSCFDYETEQKFAIKILTAKFSSYIEHAEDLISYMVERNSMVQATKSPFVVKIYYSLQFKEAGFMVLFTECCIGDLTKIVHNITFDYPVQISTMIAKHEPGIIQKLHGCRPHLLEAMYVYIFELICGVDFLVRCNIIHRDLKPDNILIADNLHLKIGDFGLTQRMRTIHMDTNELLVKVTDLDKVDETNFKDGVAGTMYYQDLELQLKHLKGTKYDDFRMVFAHMDKFSTPGILFNDEILRPNFLVDTWAIGVIAIELLFRGFDIIDPDHADPKFFLDVPLDLHRFVVHLVGRLPLYTKYIKNGLKNAGEKENEELMLFLASIFKPRSTRCVGYTKEKEVYHLNRPITMRYVDLDKIEELPTFSKRRFNRSNIHLQKIHKNVRKIFKGSKEPDFETFGDMLSELMEEESADNIMNFEPGITLNFFS